jgi:hypothetical protein
VFVCVCVCVGERERERQKQREREREETGHHLTHDKGLIRVSVYYSL